MTVSEGARPVASLKTVMIGPSLYEFQIIEADPEAVGRLLDQRCFYKTKPIFVSDYSSDPVR